MNIGDKVYVQDWGQRYSCINDFKFNTIIPPYSKIDFFWKTISEPKLTLLGKPYKNGDTVILDRIPVYENFKYTILEMKLHPSSNKNVCLIKSDEGCCVAIGEEGISKLTKEQYERKEFDSLREANLGKWVITDDLKTFPKKLLKYLYDQNQSAQFGSEMTGATIKYPYIEEKFTKNNNPLALGWEMSYDGGCDLSDKETITWEKLQEKFPDNKFA